MATDNLADLIELYIARCNFEGKTARTVQAYRWTLGRFLHALPSTVAEEPASIKQEHIYTYLAAFTGLSLDTRHRYYREVDCFFNWLVTAGYLTSSPFAKIHNVRLPQRIVRPYTLSDIRLLLAACPATPQGRRDRAILLTLLDTGLRVSELAQLTLDDLDMATMRLRVLHGKGSKQRVASFSVGCAEELLGYLNVRGTDPGPLFTAVDGNGNLRAGVALQPNGVKQMLRRLGRVTGLPKVHAHRFRHTFATWSIEAGARELDVQLLLGHASPEMVRRYASSYNVEQAARRHGEFSPAGRLSAGG
jgi:integrase/recombinase XerC